MNHLEDNNIHTITLDVRISCDTFWDYRFNIPIRINDYYDRNYRGGDNDNDNDNDNHNDNDDRSDPKFKRLQEYLVDYVIQHIYDDLIQKRQHRDIPILLKKARKFHIHGRTLEDLLFPGNQDRMMPENIVYVCTH